MMLTLGTFGPQRQVLYSASKGVNSSVGLPVFFRGHVPPAEMISFFIKNTDLQQKNGIFSGFLLP